MWAMAQAHVAAIYEGDPAVAAVMVRAHAQMAIASRLRSVWRVLATPARRTRARVLVSPRRTRARSAARVCKPRNKCYSSGGGTLQKPC